MESRLNELTQKLYQEGIEKAKKEADVIISEARKEAEKILNEAKKEAENLKNNAAKEVEQLKSRANSEIKIAGDQAIVTLKQEILNILTKSSLSNAVNQAINSKDVIVSVIKEIASKWNLSSDMNIIISDKLKSDLESVLKKEIVETLKNGVEIKFDDKMKNGFKITPKDNSFVLSFSDEDFISFFQSFLRPKAKEILFPGA